MRDHSLALLLTFFILPFAHAQAPDELSQSVAVAENSLWFERNVKVNSGHVIVNGVATGTTLFPGADMVLGRETDTPASYWVAADSVGIDIYSEIGSDVYVNTLTTHPNITLTGQQLPYTAPVLPTLPMFQSSTPGTEDIYLDGGSWNKWPGRYGDLTIVDGTLELRGGNYTFQDITIESSGNLKFTGPAVVRVKGRLWMGNWSELNDPTGAGVTIYVEGQNGTDGALTSTPAAVELGNGADVEATIFAPNGTISSDGNVDGALIARDVYIDSHSSLTLASTFSAADVVPIADGRDLLARQDALLTFDLEASGPTGTQLTFQVATSPANGTLNFVQTLDNYTASFTYQPDPGYVGSDSFAFEVVAGGATSLPAQVDIRVQPSVDMEFEKTVALATNSLEFKREVYVKSGHVIVNEPANGPSLIDGFDLFMGRGSDFPDSFAVKGDRVFAAFYGTYDADIESRTLTGQGQVYQSTHSGLRVRGAPWPVFATLPPFETGTPGTQVVDVDAANGSQVIVAGDFDTITVGDSASLEFGPGIYNLNSFTVGPQSRVKFDGQVTLRIADRMMVANNARLEPKAADGNPSEIIIYVAGSNGGAGGIADTPAALDSGNYSHIRANLYVPNGTIRSDATRFEGAMIARDIQLGQGATLTLDNGFIDGTGGVGPFADPQTISLDEDTSATVTLTGSGGQGALSFSVSVAPMYGQLSGTAPNLTYTPNADFNGTDNFVFVADDGTNQSSPAVVTLEVLPVADAPVAFDGSGTTDFDQPLDLTVSASDGDGDTLTYSVTTPPASGTLNGTGPNYTYTPNAGFSGTDSFVFEASDGTLISNAATFTITVVSTTQPPIASDGTVTLDEDSSAAFVLNASDPNNDPLTYTILTAPTQGLLTGTEPNLTYTPSANFNGTDTLTFSVNDGTADSNVATVTFTVNPVNDPPVANSDSIGLDEDTSANIVISASDIDGDTLSYQVITSPAQGTLSGIGPNYTYTPAANFNGADSFTVVANDGSVDSNLATVTLAVSPVNDEPVANGGAVSVNEDDAVPVTLTGSDVDGDALSFEVIRSPVNGSLTGTAPNLTYAPAPDFNGTDSFDFRAADGTTVSGNATFTITVNPVNDAPTALPQTLNAIAGEALNVTLAGQDIDSTTLSFTVTQGPTNGTLSGSGANQVYTANLGFSGSDQFSFVANDGALDSSPAVVTITVQPGNQAPTVDPIADAVVAAGQLFTESVAATDPDSDPLTYSLNTAPAAMNIDAAGVITWQTAAADIGVANVEVAVSDGQLTTTESFQVTVNDPGTSPVITSVPPVLATEDQLYEYLVQATDADGDVLTYALTDAPVNMLIDPQSGQIDWTPQEADVGEAMVTVRAVDPSGNFDEQTYEIQVLASIVNKSHLGTEFWASFSRNHTFSNSNNGGAPANSVERSFWVDIATPTGATGTVEIPGLAFLESFTGLPGESVRVTLPYQVMATQDGLLSGHGVHVLSDNPVTVTAVNRLIASTDSYLVYPVGLLGTQYRLIDFYDITNDSGHFAVTAIEDNTTFQVLPKPEQFIENRVGGFLISDQPFSITLNTGEVYTTIAGPESLVSGLLISSDKPVMVTSGAPCASVPRQTGFCDYLAEQMLPDENVGARFFTVPLATRFRGDLHRFVALQDGTELRVNGLLVATMEAGEVYERIVEQAAVIESNKPVTAAQFSMSNYYDRDLRTDPPEFMEFADPFMVQLPPVSGYLREYVFQTTDLSTPQNPVSLQFVNVIIPQAALASLELNGAAVDTSGFAEINNTGFYGGSVEVVLGPNVIRASEPMGVTVYGFNSDDSYGTSGGLAINGAGAATTVTVTPETQSVTLGELACVEITHVDAADQRIPLSRFFAEVSGTQSVTAVDYVSRTGRGEYCFGGVTVGTDMVDVTTGSATDSATVTWTAAPQNLAPVITSVPDLDPIVLQFGYPVVAIDPNGDAVTYSLVQSPSDMVIDAQTGVLTWNFEFTPDRSPTADVVIVRAQDPAGLFDEQAFEISLIYPPQISILPSFEIDETFLYTDRIFFEGGQQFKTEISLLEGPADMTVWSRSRLLDYWDIQQDNVATSPAVGTLGEFNPLCRADVPNGDVFYTETRWQFAGPTFNVTAVAPLADTNGDGAVDAADRAYLVGLSGASVHVIDPVSGEQISEFSDNRIRTAFSPAIADVTGDGIPEILVATRTGEYVVTAFSVDGVQVWESQEGFFSFVPSTSTGTNIQVVDLENDGSLEIIAGGTAISVATGLRLWRSPWGFEETVTTTVHNVVQDLDGDGIQEVLYADSVFAADGTLLWTTDAASAGSNSRGHFSVANLDSDPELEVVVSLVGISNDPDEIIAFEHDGSVRFGPLISRGPQIPAIGDYDGDGQVEILLPTDRLVLESDGETLSSYFFSFDQPFQVAVGDLNQDGLYEYVASTGPSFQIVDVLSGAVLHQANIGITGPAGSRGHGPLLIDVDRDGTSELFLHGRNSALVAPQVGTWPAAVQTFEQFRQTNVWPNSVDLHIPAQTNPSPLPDLWVDTPQAEATGSTYRMWTTVRNRGVQFVDQPVLVELFRGDPDSGGTLLGSVQLDGLGAGESYYYELNNLARSDLSGWMFARVSSALAEPECEVINNKAAAHVVEVNVSDRPTYSEQLLYLLQVRQRIGVPVITSTAPNTVNVGSEYYYDVEWDVSGTGNQALAVLNTNVPDGVRMNPFTGQIRWTPTVDQVGNNTITLRVRDIQGNTASHSFSVNVVDTGNQPPVITGDKPGRFIPVSVPFAHTIEATDPEGGALSYSVLTGPSGMTVDASGVINWTPGVPDLGVHTVVIAVTDPAGSQALCEFVLEVIDGNNLPPSIDSAAPTQAKVGFSFDYPVAASDPENDPLTYSVLNGPAGMAFTGATLSWTPSAAQTVPVTIAVSDGATQVTQQWLLSVSPGGDLMASLVATPNPVVKNASISVTVAGVDAAGPVTRELTVDGVNVFLDADGKAQISAGDIGQRVLVATVTDPYQTDSNTQLVDVIAEGDAEVQVQIISPADGEEINGLTDVIGTVSGLSLASWRTTLLRHGEVNAVEIGSGTGPVTNDVVGSIDPTMLLNGIYEIFFEATDTQGETSVDFVTIALEGDFKIGNFSITFEDLSIPTPGIPITVNRTYDTRIRQDSLDFGHGWTLSYNDVRIQENRRPGFGWLIVSYPSGPLGLIPNQCVETNGENVVAVTMSDGDVKRFRAKAEPECTQLQATTAVDIVFEAIGDENGAKLEALDGNFGLLSGGSIIEPGYGPIDPTRYKLTTEEGLEITIDQGDGVKEIFEHEGQNLITISDDGVIHSAGPSVTFVRDAQDRITSIVAPDNTVLTYDYDANGDLQFFTDQETNVTEFTYLDNPNLDPHYLEDIIDPRGIRVARNEYDDDGRLVAHIDAEGNRIDYSHDIVGQTSQITDRRGNTTLYVYNSRGDVLVETNALGESITRTYDDNGNMLTQVNDLGHQTRWEYDNLGNQVLEEDALLNVTRTEYGPFRQLEGQLDPTMTYVMFNEYSNTTIFGEPVFPGPLRSTTDALGNRTNFLYDPTTGQVARITDAEGGFTETEYNADGYVTATIDARGVRTDYEVDDNGRRTSETTTRTDENDVVQTLITRYEYDDKGRLTKTIDPLLNETITEYNAIDKVSRVIDARGRITEYEYDDRGNLELTRYPDLTTETMLYDENGNLVETTDRLGRVTKMTYDLANRLEDTIYPDSTPGDDTDNPRTTNNYDSAGRLTSTVDEEGNTTHYGYDDAGRRTSVTNALNQTTDFEYDTRGLRDGTVDALLRRTKFVYDAASRLKETIYPDDTPLDDTDNLRTLMDYDKLGRKTSETDMAGLITRFEYDEVGNLKAVVDALMQRTEYDYDEQGNKILQRDASQNVTRWGYDDLGRVTSRTLPGGQRETFTYDDVGNRDSRTDFNGDLTTYQYDDLNRLTHTNYPDGTSVVNTYTATGQLDTITDYRGVTDHDYDERDRLTRITYPNGDYIDYTYDKVGNRTSLTTANQVVTYTFDDLNRLETVTDATGVTTYAYDVVGNREGITHANGTVVSYLYDDLNRLTDLVNEDSSGNVITEHHYTLGDAGNRLQMQEQLAGIGGGPATVRTVDYGYDDLYRLTSETVTDAGNGNSVTTWTYDDTGNRLTQTNDGVLTSYVYDANDRLERETTGAVVTTYTYDANGSTLSRTEGTSTTTYVYDFEKRLIDVGDGQITYTYSPDNIRQSQTFEGLITAFLVDPNRQFDQVIEDHAGGLAVIYTYGDDLLSQQLSGATAYTYFYDGLGSVRALSSPAGAAQSYSYGAFGTLSVQDGGVSNSFLFAGERYDSAVGLYYLRARYYDEQNSRFHTMDPFLGFPLDPQSLNKYVYAHGNPVNRIDPLGLFTLKELQTAMSSVGNLITRSSRAFGRGSVRLGYQFARRSGEVAQTWVRRIVNECLKPKRTRENVRINPNGSRRQIDLIAELDESMLRVEAKNKIPSSGSRPLRRLKDQLLESRNVGQRTVVVGGDKVSNSRIEEVIKHFERAGLENGKDFEIINGFVDFALWLTEVYGEECIGI